MPYVMMGDESGSNTGFIASLTAILDQAGVPGAVIAARIDGREAFRAALGYRDLDRRVPIADGDRFSIYSVTKPLLAMVTLRLVERGQVRLDRPVITYLPDLPSLLQNERVTLRRVLNHTAGIPDYGRMPEYAAAVRASPGDPWTAGEFMSRTLERGLVFPPGEGWAYSNIGYLILKRLVERLYGVPLQEVLQAEVFAPLGLDRVFVADSLASAVQLSPGYSAFFARNGSLEDISRVYHPGWVSHGVVISDVPDLARMIEAIVGVKSAFVSDDLRAIMLEPVRVPVDHPLFRGPAYGLGVMIDVDSPYGLAVGHGGGGPGYSIGAFHFTDVDGHDVTVSAIANSDRSDIGMRLAFSTVEMIAVGAGRVDGDRPDSSQLRG